MSDQSTELVIDHMLSYFPPGPELPVPTLKIEQLFCGCVYYAKRIQVFGVALLLTDIIFFPNRVESRPYWVPFMLKLFRTHFLLWAMYIGHIFQKEG